MLKEYDEKTSFHYSAYRPPLHAKILNESFDKGEEHGLGLDVGCGTGQSSIALANYCERVIGIEPSKEMLDNSLEHSFVEYRDYNCEYFDFPDDYFDVMTFAGSLYYAKSQQLLDEVERVCKPDAKVVIYDFELLLDALLKKLAIHNSSPQSVQYDHQADFEGLIQKNIRLEKRIKRSFSLDIHNSNLVHILLSAKERFIKLRHMFGKENLHDQISRKLHAVINKDSSIVEAMTYSTIYRIVK